MLPTILLSIHILGQVVIIKINSKYLHTKLLHTICYTQRFQLHTDYSGGLSNYCLEYNHNSAWLLMYDRVDGTPKCHLLMITQSLKITMNLCTQDEWQMFLDVVIYYEKSKA